MNPIIERRLDDTARQLQMARAIRFSAVFFSLVTLAILLVGVAGRVAWISASAAWVLVYILLIGGSIVWFVTLVVRTAMPLPRRELARETERIHPGLMDRLHTLIAIATNPRVGTESYAKRIERQSAAVLYGSHARVPLLSTQSLRWLATWSMLAFVTFLFFQWFDPLTPRSVADGPSDVPPESPGLELTQTPEADTETPSIDPWIEARILEPGQDLVVTRYETIPLVVEAASSSELARAGLHTTHNGHFMPERPLSVSADPHFSRNEDLLSPEAIGATDWDVLTYHATAESKDGLRGGSRIYFVEVRPFREELEQLPGGVAGEPYRVLNELTNLVSAEQDAIRAAHRMNQLPADQVPPSMSRDLAESQQVMKTAVDYLKKSLPANDQVAGAVEQLDQAAQSLQQAADQFRTGDGQAAEQAAQKAIGHLAASRKEIHQAVKQNPDALPPPHQAFDPLADMAEQLEKWNESQQQTQAAAEQAAKLASDQREIAQQIKPCQTEAHQTGAQKQRELREQLEQFRKDFPQVDEQSATESAGAQTAVNSAVEAIEQLAAKHDNPTHKKANDAASQAGNSLQQLANSLRQRAQNEQAAATEQLKQALDEQIKFLEQIEQDPESATAEELKQAAESMQATTDEIKKRAEDPPTRDQFSDELREMLSDENKERLDKQ